MKQAMLRAAVEAGCNKTAHWIANLILIPLVTFYLLRDWPALLSRIGELVPRQSAPVVFRLAQECDATAGSFAELLFRHGFV